MRLFNKDVREKSTITSDETFMNKEQEENFDTIVNDLVTAKTVGERNVHKH